MAASHVITFTLALTLTLSLSLGQAGGVLLNALAMVAMLAGVTTLMMLLYRWRCYKLMYGWLLFSVASLLYSFGGLVLEQARVRVRVRVRVRANPVPLTEQLLEVYAPTPRA